MFTLSEIQRLFTLDESTGTLFWRIKPADQIQIGDVAGGLNVNGRWSVRIRGKIYYRSRLNFLYIHGYCPKEVDHRNLNTADDRPSNLRVATHFQQQGNTKGRSKKGFPKGVDQLPSGRYRAKIRIGGKVIHLGVFDTSEEANNVYFEAAKKYFGEFARR